MESLDLVVVGLGAMGAATAMHARRAGLSVLGIDRFDPPHGMGSTHGDSRITRLAVGEGSQYLPFVARSHEIWRELEADTGVALLHECGGIIVTGPDAVAGQRWEDFVTETDRIARGAGIEFDVLDPVEIRRRLPALVVPDDRKVGFEPTAGLLLVDRAVEVQLDVARSSGARLHTNERVLELRPDTHGVDVVTDRSTYRGSHVVLATGPWFRELAHPRDGDQITVTRQVVFWFEADDLDAFSTDRFPFVMWIDESDEDYVAVFPVAPGTTPAVKALGEQFLEATDPDSVDRTVGPAEIADFHRRLVGPKVRGISDRCVRAEVCLYSNTPDDHFLIDADPRSDRITVMSPCSGHGFKHSTALGEAVVQQIAEGTSRLDLTPFRAR